uniref:Cullin 7 n=1 Tax=Naja naja TaxID=35670 RepID=A0A8C6VFM6_NAJNA
MVGEKRNGNLGPKLQAYAEELIRQRRGHDGRTEYLIRWSILSLDDNVENTTHAASTENKMDNILMWMSAEEVYANCPTLLGKRKPEGQRVKEEKSPSTFPSDVTVDEASLHEMKADVRSLVQRANRQMARTSGPESSILNTVHVLSAYASIGSLTGVFKETGALDLLMKMLCNEEKQIRRSAGKMLRALASHDAGSRAYVLLSLSQQDGIEQHMDFDSRYTLLELFAETTSSEEHCMSFEGIHLPQIPGKLLFSLVKRYLCVTSLMDKLNSTTELGGDHQDSSAPSSTFGEKSRAQREFDFSMAMANLISELVRVMGWDRSQERELLSLTNAQPRIIRSIFQPKGSTCTAVQVPLVTSKPSPRKKESLPFMTLSDFSSRSSYVEYVQESLKPGMTVRMLEEYEEIDAGDEGEFRQSNSGMPPVQVLWQSTGQTYWVHWHMIEIIGSREQNEEDFQVCFCFLSLSLSAATQTFYCKPLGGLYCLPYLVDQLYENSGMLNRAEWWELLFFIKKLEQHEQQEIVQFIQRNHEEQLSELDEEGLIQLSISVELARKLLPLLSKYCQGCTQNDLQNSHIYLKYTLSKGSSEQDCQSVDMTSAKDSGFSEAMAFKNQRNPFLLKCLLQCCLQQRRLTHTTTNKDCAVVMCRVGTKEALTKAMDKHNSNLLLVTELRDLVTDCEKYASLYKKMTTSILAGCIQMVLGQIEEHRRSHQPINIPFFDVFLRNLCQGSNVEVKEDKCWERIEVSSNPHRANKLTDKNPKTYWESNGSTGSHYINVYIHRGVVVRQMTLIVASEDSSYMPARIVVMGGENTSSITNELNTVNVLPTANRVVLLENMGRFWPIIQIKIKRCQQGGIDTRVRGIEVLGPKPTFWPIFKEQLCRRTYLFYTTKAHTWCQEILEDRMQLLQLFNRLNSALRHEQVFANRFLPDDEAAQALGKTCWEALITPLVQSITSPDSSGISPMSWLLTQYLENLHAARNSMSRASIFNSRVRRLSHLLVHVDSAGPELEELKPPIKTSECPLLGQISEKVANPSSSLDKKVEMCLCLFSVVQVKCFLESSWQAPDFVEQYCRTYQRLRTAMEELFGQQISFMLALCHGFSGALLQLSFLTAMHVSEQFARYIDRWIQQSWADSGNVETFQCLQQSLEPVLFLADLELANTFERFYRYYLGDRLLSQGKTWLESSVVDHIGICFPNRFPQQMLKNLSDMEEQQQQFHLFQLQQLDKHLLELDQQGNQEEEEEEEENEVISCLVDYEPFSQEEEAEVKVLALSPRCWTISPLCYLEDPARFFPSSLSQQLRKFADFYTQSRSHFGMEHTKPQRLQWTWLGHAELKYQGYILQVSTLQMYILLLNEGTLCQASGQRLWLLPKQMYLNVEENEGCALEKKRNTICCLLVQILKAEKEMHIDNLVFKVIDVCQKRESGSTQKFLNFCCSSTDVLSCILHLLSQGYIQRQEDNPHILEYISADPTTPHRGQAQLMFQNVNCQKSKIASGTDATKR